MQGDDPPYLPVGTAVSAKYKGAFCEAKVSKVVRCVKCKITYKMGLGTATVTDEQIKGPLRVGHTVQARHSEKKEFIEATISKIQDCSQYTVVFDDGDITTLRRTALCLKSGRHFNESETLDQLPLTHPEHFGNPVVGGRRGRRSRQLKEDSSEGEPEEEAEPDLDLYSGDIGKVICVEGNEKKKSKDNWFPGLVVVPSAQPTVRINVREEYLVRSFKDGRYYTVPKKEISEFSRDMGARIESTALSEAMDKAIRYLDRDELPVHWERASLFDLQIPDSDSDENYSDSSDDEPREEKDHFVAQLYKFMDDRGTPLNKSPMIANRDVDLYRLFRVVHKLGGYNRVTNQSKWRSVTIRLGYQHNQATYNSVKQAYKKYLFSFEEFYRKLGCTMINHPRNAKKHRGRNLIRDRDRATPVNSSPRQDPSEDTNPEPPEKKEEEKPVVVVVLRPKSALSKKVIEKEEEKIKRKEIIESSDSSSSSSCTSSNNSNNSNSSEETIDVQSDSGQSSTTKKTEPKKKVDTKSVKERKVKAPGEKVKALVEQFEEQSKKEAKEDEKDKTQQTRSKSSQGPKIKEVSSPERKETLPIRGIIKTPKKQDEEKRRGRKRKDAVETEVKEKKETTPEPTPPIPSTTPVNIGDKLKVYYGPTHESKVTYEAKVLDIERNSTGIVYRVHYTGWNTRYDEWIKPARIAENLSNTTKAKRLKQSQTPGKSTPPKAAGKRGRGQSVSSRTHDLPPRSTTPSSVTSSSSRTKSPATPASSKSASASTSRITRGGAVDSIGNLATHRRTRKTSTQTDVSVLSESDSDSDQSESELSRTRSGTKSDEVVRRRPLKRKEKEKEKDDEDTEKEEDERPKRVIKRKKTPEPKSSTAESDDDSSSPPKGRDFDLNQIRSELKGFEKAVKIATSEASAEVSEEIPPVVDIKPLATEKKSGEKAKTVEKSLSTDDIYEFKEPEPFEFEARASKLNEDKTTKKRLVPRIFEELEKTPKKKGGKSPKNEIKEEEKKRTLKRTPVKKIEDEEEKTPIKEEITPVKSRPVSSCEDPFDKLVESPSFNIGHSLVEKKSPPSEPVKSKVVKSLNMDETLSLFRELPETVGDDSRDRLDMSDTDDTQTEPLFSHKEQIFSDSSFSKAETSTLDPIFRGFTDGIKSESGDESKKRSIKDSQSDEDDSITAAIQRAISNTMTDEDSIEDDLFITQPTTIYQPKLKPKEENTPSTPTTLIVIKKEVSPSSSFEDIKEPLSINTKDETKEQKEAKDVSKPKQISPALQETDSSLLEAISLQTEMLKKEDTREPQIKTGTKIADSILQKFNMIKKNEEIKPVVKKVEPKLETPAPKVEKLEEPIKKEIKPEPEAKQIEVIPEPPIKTEPSEIEFPVEVKKRSNKKVVSREFIEESDTDSTDSEERLVIARSDDDSQTNISDKLDFKEDTDSNASAVPANTDDSQECERNFKLETIKPEPIPEPVPEPEPIKRDPEPIKTEEEPESNISLLLCKETIPGSPAPVPEMSPATTEPRTKPKSAKSLLLEMPFASAPGSSNSKGMLNPVEHASQQKKQQVAIEKDPQPLAVPLEAPETNDTNTVNDNSSPTTPESTISNLSPRGDPDRISPNTADNESCKSTDSGQRAQTSKVTHYSEEDTLMTTEPCPAPKKTPREETAAPCRKRRRSCKASDEIPVKRGRKPNVRNVRANSDSDDTSEHSAPTSTPPAGGSTPNASTSEPRLSSHSPRPSKFNFIIELDPSMECCQRISLLTQKLSELRKTYNTVKTELACIDRRRKKLRRREREALKAAKQEMACS